VTGKFTTDIAVNVSLSQPVGEAVPQGMKQAHRGDTAWKKKSRSIPRSFIKRGKAILSAKVKSFCRPEGEHQWTLPSRGQFKFGYIGKE